MSWTYLEHNEDGDRTSGDLPPKGSVCLVFEALRWRVMLGYLEPSSHEGYTSILDPHVNDDCGWIAWAPLSETSSPDVNRLAVCNGGKGPAAGYATGDWPELMRADPDQIQRSESERTGAR